LDRLPLEVQSIGPLMREAKLTAAQVAYIFGYEKLKALRLICEANNEDVTDFCMELIPNPDNDPKKADLWQNVKPGKLPMHHSYLVGEFDTKHPVLRIEMCIQSIRDNILKDKAAIDFLCKELSKKVKPAKGTSLYPKEIRIPWELRMLIDNEATYELLIERVKSVLGRSLYPAKDQVIEVR